MKLKLIVLAFFWSAISLQPVFADDIAELKAQLKAMQQKMLQMQAQLDAQEAALQKQQTAQEISPQAPVAQGQSSVKRVAHEVADSMTIGGVIEVVSSQTDSDGWTGEKAGDIVLDTFELGIEASATEWVSGSILFLYEDAGDDNLLVDEAYVTIGNADETPWYVSAGRLYVPFGNFSSNMISDPATLTLAETREDVVQLGFDTEVGFYGSAYLFNGDAEKAKSNYAAVDNNTIDNYGLNLGYVMENDDLSLDLGIGYINNIATSDTLQDAVDGNTLCAGNACIKDYVAGMSLYAVASFGQFNLIGEYVSAMDEFEANEISGISADELKPAAWNIEAAYHFALAGKDATVALGYQKTRDLYLDAETTDLFEKAWLASLSVAIYENTTLAAEWRHAEAYNEVEAAVGADYEDEDLLQLKLSYEF